MKKLLLLFAVLFITSCSKGFEDYKPKELMNLSETELTELKQDMNDENRGLMLRAIERYGAMRFMMLDVPIKEILAEQKELEQE